MHFSIQKNIANNPIIRILIFIIIGIILYDYAIYNFKFYAISLVIVVFCILIFNILPLYFRLQFKWIYGVFVYLICIIFGYFIHFFQDVKNDTSWFGNRILSNSSMQISIQKNISKNKYNFKTVAKVEYIFNDSIKIKTHGKINVIIYDSLLAKKFLINSRWIIKNKLKPIKAFNIQQKNYLSYLYRQQIYYQQTMDNSIIYIPEKQEPNLFQKSINNIQQNIISILQKNIKNPQTIGIAEALLIGYQLDLDKSLLLMYSNTGVIHIIAISGMHLSLIYGLLIFIFNLIKLKVGWYKKFTPIFILLIIWIFTFVAGASSSIVRASIIFTFINIAHFFNKKNFGFNTLGLSAFILLIINCNYLWDIGFQLTYLAVLSIMIYYKPILNLFEFKNKIALGIWTSIAVCLSAQILTFPIIIFYFKQFPVLFLFTNLGVVGLSSLILYAEIILLVVYKINFLAIFFGKIINIGIDIMNRIVIYFDKIPYSTIRNFNCSLQQICFIYTIIAILTTWFVYNKKENIKYFLAFFIIIQIIFLVI